MCHKYSYSVHRVSSCNALPKKLAEWNPKARLGDRQYAIVQTLLSQGRQGSKYQVISPIGNQIQKGAGR